ncbi:methyl-accepting chemotaxis protein [Methanoplanus limicola]|uniref:Methyl-accepting chemotaxis sensory transducer n=1 Tax=Methanoplanus limicola DSM 2279 TaxID=937775 RepID=H1YYQ3_9EURY|nr:methyl-accepting chemotaxis protein [Methanoplanus limicola]EHQ36036.1 methyl-accepting chemotaxis sensory transducer [Methanoplanus limicola DSM 2279]
MEDNLQLKLKEYESKIEELTSGISLYKSILDAVPFPISVTDMDMNWIYMNPATARMANVDPERAKGTHCSSWGTAICNTENCAFKQLRQGKNDAFFDQAGQNFKCNMAYVRDESGQDIGMMEIVQDVSDMIRVANYLNNEVSKAADNLELLAGGNLNLRLDVAEADEYTRDVRDQFVLINQSIGKARDAVQLLVEDSVMLGKAGVEGRLDTRADESRHNGEFRKIVQGVNNTLDAVVDPLNLAAENLDRISKGDIPERITAELNGDFNKIKDNLNQCIDAVNLLVKDAGTLAQAGVDGRLNTRADASKHNGDFAVIVKGVNDTLDAVVGPLGLSADVLDRISKGDIPEKITADFKGDFNQIKDSLNQCIDAVNQLVEDAGMLAEGAIGGRVDIRADATRHRGDFRKIVVGVNDTLAAIEAPVKEITEITKNFAVNDYTRKVEGRYKGTFAEVANAVNDVYDTVNLAQKVAENIAAGDLGDLGRLKSLGNGAGKLSQNDKLVPAFIGMMEVMKAFEIEFGKLVNFAAEGKTGMRANASEFNGIYNNIITGANQVLDNILTPLNEGFEALDRISHGNIALMTKTYKGDYEDIKKNINAIASVLQEFKAEFDKVVKYADEGAINERLDSSKFEGAYAEVIDGANQVLDNILTPLNEGFAALDRISHGNIEPMTRTYKGEYENIKKNINAIAFTLQSFEKELNILIKAAVDGNLDKRADSSQFEGAYAKVIDGANAIMEAIDVPVQETLRMANAYEACRFDTRVNENITVKGDFLKLKNALNNVGVAVGAIVNEIQRIADEFEAGHFDTRVDERLNVVGDIVAIKQGLNNVGEVVSGAISDVKVAVDRVNRSSDEVSKGTDEVSRAAEGVATTSQNAANMTKELLGRIEGINQQIADLSSSNEEIAGTSQEVLNRANEVVAIGKEAQVAGDDANAKMGNVEAIAKQSVDEINGLTEQIKEVNNVVKLINDIASQINLLALNAAIEAARAGEHGRGFAVVAGEVKNLAAEAREATGNIEKVVSAVQANSIRTADAINLANNEIVDGVGSVNTAIKALNRIIENAGQVTLDITEITRAIEDQAGIANNVVVATENGMRMTKDVQGQAEELAALAEEASASIEEIGSAIHEVSGLSGGLKENMDKFRV